MPLAGRNAQNPFGPFGASGPHSSEMYYVYPGLSGGRLALSTGTPVNTTDIVSGSNLYYTPYLHNRVSLWSSGEWREYTFSEVTYSYGNLTAGSVYDFYLTSETSSSNASLGGGSNIALVPGPVWTSTTARAEALVRVDGVWTRPGHPNWLYVGTVYVDTGSIGVDSAAKRYVWNMYNRVPRKMMVTEPIANWTWNGGWRASNGNTANRLQFVRGLDLDAQACHACSLANNLSATIASGIGLDSTSVNSAQIYGSDIELTTGNATRQIHAFYNDYPGQGFHFLQWLETANSQGAVTFWSNRSPSPNLMGIEAMVLA